MSRRKPSTTALLDETAQFARALLKRVSKGTVPAQSDSAEPETQAVDVDTQIAALSVVTRWVAVQHRIRPEDDDDSEFDRLRGKLGAGAGSKPGSGRTKALGRAGGEVGKASNGAGSAIVARTLATTTDITLDDDSDEADA